MGIVGYGDGVSEREVAGVLVHGPASLVRVWRACALGGGGGFVRWGGMAWDGWLTSNAKGGDVMLDGWELF